jgi:hypothetical protein
MPADLIEKMHWATVEAACEEGRSSASPAEVFAEIWAEAEEVEFIEPSVEAGLV